MLKNNWVCVKSANNTQILSIIFLNEDSWLEFIDNDSMIGCYFHNVKFLKKED